MGKKKKKPEEQIPEGYTAEEWAEYQADPVSFCIKELSNTEEHVRFNAVDILRGLAWDAEAAIPALCELLKKEKVTTIRAQTVWALQEICESVDAESAQIAVKPLANALSDCDTEVRILAANALQGIGEPAKSAIPKLKKALKDDNEEVREAVEQALESLESE